MPYLKLEQRNRFNEAIQKTVELINHNTDTKSMRGEYFGFFVNRLCRIFLQTADFNGKFFNSDMFNEAKRNGLISLSDKLGHMFSKDDPMNSARELSYVIAAIMWGLLGDAEGVESADYGYRVYLKGMLEQVRTGLQQAAFAPGERRQHTLNLRRFVTVSGVLSDVLDEFYRRRMSSFETQRLKESADLWVEGQLAYKEKETAPAPAVAKAKASTARAPEVKTGEGE